MTDGTDKPGNSNEPPSGDGSKSPEKACPEGHAGENEVKSTSQTSSRNSSCEGPPKNSRAPNDTPASQATTSGPYQRPSRNHQNQRPVQNLANAQNSESKREKALQDEATRLFCEMASDPDIMDQAFSAAVNPNVAMELARQADTAWRNIETLPGGFRALCQMHHNLQQPLWNAVIGQDLPKVSKYQSSDLNHTVPNEPIKAEPMPNPWKTEPQRRPSNARGLAFPFDDFNPFSFSNFNDTLPGQSTSSRRPRDEMLSSVISRTHSSSFQTASQLIQNSASKYSKEIEELAEMGLTDREKCLSALEAADGDLFQALGILQNLEELDKEEGKNK